MTIQCSSVQDCIACSIITSSCPTRVFGNRGFPQKNLSISRQARNWEIFRNYHFAPRKLFKQDRHDCMGWSSNCMWEFLWFLQFCVAKVKTKSYVEQKSDRTVHHILQPSTASIGYVCRTQVVLDSIRCYSTRESFRILKFSDIKRFRQMHNNYLLDPPFLH